MAKKPSVVVVDSIQQCGDIDEGKGVRLETILQGSGDALRIVFPFTIAGTVRALLAASDMALQERQRRGTAAADDVAIAFDVKGVHVGPTSNPDQVGLGFELTLGGTPGFALDRAAANRLAELLSKWAASPQDSGSGPSGHSH